MYSRHWDILIVDDEPDVLAASRLALRGVSVYGLPLRLHEATSKASALELLGGPLSRQVQGISQVAVAFIDVVMETDHAGLELCRHIREEMGNRTTQLYVRTGQPGIAPERAVIDHYDINGYTHKVDATPDRLYMLIKSGVRQHYATSMARIYANLLRALVPASDSRDRMKQVLDAHLAGQLANAQGQHIEGTELRTSFIADGQVIAGTWHPDPRETLAYKDQLARLPGVPLGGGDKYVVDGNSFLIHVAEGPTTDELSVLSTATAPPPEFWLSMLHGYVQTIAALWRKAVYTTRIRQDVNPLNW